MQDIILSNIYKKYNNEDIFIDFSLTIPGGKFFALLGPSGCGKTTILRILSGFEFPDSGKIFLGNQDITFVEPHLRKIHTVFQNYALFPHLNVYENIAYALNARNIDSIMIRKEVEKIAESFNITKYLYKEINTLSGGQQQRVAIARAIINQPLVLLLDEPLSALDVQLRHHMLRELIDLQDLYKMTFVYITHDQSEAMAVADYIAIIDEFGQINQIGEPQKIYNYPETAFVAKFFANTNLIKVTCQSYEGNVFLKSNSNGFLYDIILNDTIEKNIGKKGFLSIHAEKCFISKEKINNRNFIEGKVISIIYQGSYTEFFIQTDEGIIRIIYYYNNNNFYNNKVYKNFDHDINYDDIVYVSWNTEDILFLER